MAVGGVSGIVSVSFGCDVSVCSLFFVCFCDFGMCVVLKLS